jgi:hypothetical protein
MEILPSDILTGRKSKTINSCGKSKENGTRSYGISYLVGAALASLPSKFVVFSPNGEMEKGASASALDITSRDETS